MKDQSNIDRDEVERFSRIYHEFYSDLYSYGIRICNNRSLIEDSIQDLFFTLWKTREKIENIRFLKPYLFKSFRRILIKAIKKDDRSAPLFSEDFLSDISHEERITSEEENQESKRKLKDAISKLSERQREILHLRFYEMLSYSEIAEVLSLSRNTIRNHLHLSMIVIRKSIS